MSEGKAIPQQDKHWFYRAPEYLIIPHLDVMDVFYKCAGLLADLSHLTSGNYDLKEQAIQRVAKDMVTLRGAIQKAEDSIAAVVEVFGAVADGIVEYEHDGKDASHYWVATSWHDWIPKYAASMFTITRRNLGLTTRESILRDIHIAKTFTEQDVVDAISERENSLRDLFSQIPRFELSLRRTLKARLEQELFRAWKRDFPNEEKPNETIHPDSKEAKEIAEQQEKARQEELALIRTPNDDRDEWIYKHCCDLVDYETIKRQLRSNDQWEPIGSLQGLKAAASRYAERHGLPSIPKRQRGRRTNGK